MLAYGAVYVIDASTAIDISGSRVVCVRPGTVMAAPKSPHPRETQRQPSSLYHIVVLLFSFGISGYLVYAWGDSESVKQWVSFTQPSRPIPPQSIVR